MHFVRKHWQIVIPVFLGWTVFGVFFALQNYANAVYFGQKLSISLSLALWMICGYAWMFLTPFVFFLSDKFFIERGKLSRHLTVHLIVGAIISVLQLSIFILARQLILGTYENPFFVDFQRLFVSEFHVNLLIYWIVTGILHLREINRRYLRRERETARMILETSQLETRLIEARLDALKKQLHPHFLFNTLNSISVLMREGQSEDADRMLMRLSELLRFALKTGNAQEITLKEELEFLRGYLEIEQIRFDDRLTVDFEIENETLNARVPHLILQPLVENAIRHGIAPLTENGKIRIVARRENGFVELSVSDNGAGFCDLQKTDGIGLKNTRERLEKLYGERQKLELISKIGEGFQVKIKIPLSTTNGR